MAREVYLLPLLVYKRSQRFQDINVDEAHCFSFSIGRMEMFEQ